MSTYKLQLDTTGSSQDNLITEEYHTLTESNYKDYAFIVPDFSPFFVNEDTLKVEHIQTDGSRKKLVLNIDYYPCLQFVAATRSIGKEIWGGISFVHRGIQGKIVISYQSLGGVWTSNRSYILESLHERNVNPRVIYWDAIEPDTIPESFPVIDHDQDYDTIYGQDGVIAAIDRLATIVQNGGFGVEYSKHLSNFTNPHRTTLEQLGYTVSTDKDMEQGVSNTSFITPKMFTAYTKDIRVLKADVNSIKSSIFNIENSLNTLTNTVNINKTESENKLILEINNLKTNLENKITNLDIKYENKVSVLNDGIIDQLRDHINNRNNPHQVNKVQVGLGNLQNYELATDLDVQENLTVDKYITLRQIVTYLNSNPSHVLKNYPTIITVGETINITLATERVTSGTLYIWKIAHATTTDSMFEATSGEFIVNNNLATISIKVKDSIPRRGDFQFIVNVYQGIDETRLVCRTGVISLTNPGIDDVDLLGSFSFYDPSVNDEYEGLAELMWYKIDETQETLFIDTYNEPKVTKFEKDNDLYTSVAYGIYNPILANTDQAELFYQSIDSLDETIEQRSNIK